MKTCRIFKNDTLLFSEIQVADYFVTRLVGLLRTPGLADNQGLLLKKCNQVHTFGMKFSIDVIFISKEGEIVHLQHDMAPGKVSPHVKNAYWVLELKSGSCQKYNLEITQRLVIRQ
ncbi:DUF192 domain-containing protein [Acetobacterium wieringae]|uniref:DUF192 domain-containing protein n=1 Tax=Acetobacterium wieringae TaxID=52694 RepID=UPI0026F32826|nr:DUF192 domain-containing protein [Acetobacterium wieringae]